MEDKKRREKDKQEDEDTEMDHGQQKGGQASYSNDDFSVEDEESDD